MEDYHEKALKRIAALTAELDLLEKSYDSLFSSLKQRDDERKTLKAEVARLTDNLKREMTSVALLKDDMVRLREALRKHGKHAADCDTRLDNECSCGLLSALADSKERKT
jgi:predicted  nucleic acid-binding Zn-ribbon protein